MKIVSRGRSSILKKLTQRKPQRPKDHLEKNASFFPSRKGASSLRKRVTLPKKGGLRYRGGEKNFLPSKEKGFFYL